MKFKSIFVLISLILLSSYKDYQSLSDLRNKHLKGQGTEDKPYMIHTAEDLLTLKEDYFSYYKLANDIDLSSVEWPKIDFFGVLDGGGYTIYNLTPDKSDYDIGLFSNLLGTVKNLTIEGINIDAEEENSVGGIAGRMLGGDIDNGTVILNEGSMIRGRNYVGGLVGCMADSPSDAKISNCKVISSSTSAIISGKNYVGGIAGEILFDDKEDKVSKYEIENCHVEANITGETYTGGLCGYIITTAPTAFSSCSYKGDISGESRIGGILGTGPNETTFTGCKVNANITVSDDEGGGIVGEGGSYYYLIFANCYGCYVSGTISSSNSSASYLSGIACCSNMELCYSTMTSKHQNYNAFGYRTKAIDCASTSSVSGESLTNCYPSCQDILAFISASTSSYLSLFNLEESWIWTGSINGKSYNVPCPKLSWE